MVHMFYCIFIIASVRMTKQQEEEFADFPKDIDDSASWQTMEELAEYHPYIVALLKDNNNYHCTGAIIGRASVVTAANCITPDLKYIAVGLAFIDTANYINENAIKEIAASEIYKKQTTLHKNVAQPIYQAVGLVYSATNDLDKYFGFAETMNVAFVFFLDYFNMQSDKDLVVVGYGTFPQMPGRAMQKRIYQRRPCPLYWKYGVCGTDEKYDNNISKEQTFGKGAALMYLNRVIAVEGWRCGVFKKRLTNGAGCKVFNILGHLSLPVKKPEHLKTVKEKAVMLMSGNSSQKHKFDKSIRLLLVFVVYMSIVQK